MRVLRTGFDTHTKSIGNTPNVLQPMQYALSLSVSVIQKKGAKLFPSICDWIHHFFSRTQQDIRLHSLMLVMIFACCSNNNFSNICCFSLAASAPLASKIYLARLCQACLCVFLVLGVRFCYCFNLDDTFNFLHVMLLLTVKVYTPLCVACLYAC